MEQVSSPGVDEIRNRIAKIDRIGNAQWMAMLDERKRKELELHDRDCDRRVIADLDSDTYERFYGNKKYYAATEDSKQYVENWIKLRAPGRVFLDYACGNGENAIRAAKAGATLSIGLDISRVSVANARTDAAAAGVADRCLFVQADAENTMLPDRSIDIAICSGMLHHLDLSYAFPELRRILAPGGAILAVEALDYNPFIKLYRMLTPAMRTDWEKAHILSHKDLRFASRFFEVCDVRYWHMFGILGPHIRPLQGALNRLDRVVTKIPLLRLMSWMFTFELRSGPAPDG